MLKSKIYLVKDIQIEILNYYLCNNSILRTNKVYKKTLIYILLMEYPTRYYKELDQAFHILYVEAIQNIFLDDKRRDLYIELHGGLELSDKQQSFMQNIRPEDVPRIEPRFYHHIKIINLYKY